MMIEVNIVKLLLIPVILVAFWFAFWGAIKLLDMYADWEWRRDHHD